MKNISFIVMGFSKIFVKISAEFRYGNCSLTSLRLGASPVNLYQVGDGLLAEFASVVDAVRCAVALQEEMRERNADTPESRRIRFRIGVDLGDVTVEDDDVFGHGVDAAARLKALAEPAGVVVFRTVHEHVSVWIDRLIFEDLGPQKVKNIDEPIRAFALRKIETPEELTVQYQ